MITTNEHRKFSSTVLPTRMLQGAGVALAFISLFLYGAGEPKPEWSQFWLVRPLVMVPLAGAIGGAVFYFSNHIKFKELWKKKLIIFGSFIVYGIIVWLGTVLGLDGTLWD